MPSSTIDFATLKNGFEQGDMRLLSRLLTQIEDNHSFGPEVWTYLYEQRDLRKSTLSGGAENEGGYSLTMGVTGPPGVGKSSLINEIVDVTRGLGRSVAVLSVDPSSPLTGGALLGDRIRMGKHFTDPGVFIRSLASRNSRGGLSLGTSRCLAALEAFGFDLLLLETVGVGQNEIDVTSIVDATLLVLSPGQGDDIQALKAGIMEVADIYVINKADVPGAEKLAREIDAVRAMGDEAMRAPILFTEAISGRGVVELMETIFRLYQTPPQRRVRNARRERHREFEVQSHLFAILEPRIRAELRPLRNGLEKRNPYQVAQDILANFPPASCDQPEHVTPQMDHLGVAVGDLDEAHRIFAEVLGLPVVNREFVEEDQVETLSLQAGETIIELLTARGGPIGKYLANRGAGIHHLCLRVRNLEALLADLKARGIRLIDETPRPGAHGRRVAFLHPKSTAGILIELCELPGSTRER
jgi:LAO/AO transport system kinase